MGDNGNIFDRCTSYDYKRTFTHRHILSFQVLVTLYTYISISKMAGPNVFLKIKEKKNV